jgi:hypothetical protein
MSCVFVQSKLPGGDDIRGYCTAETAWSIAGGGQKCSPLVQRCIRI